MRLFTKYLQAHYRLKYERTLRDTYITDALKNINDAVVQYLSGSVMTSRYIDILKRKEKEDARTADEIIQDIKQGLNKLGQGA